MDRSEKSRARIDRIARYAASVNLSETDLENRPIFESLEKLYKSDPKARKVAKKANERAKYLFECYTLNGPGLFVDKYLRSFLTEYNGRLFGGNGDKQPNSFNVINSFIEPDEQALVLRLLPEEHYTLSLNLILESLTDPSFSFSITDLSKCLDELRIYEYHVMGGYSEISFNDLNLTFHGLAFVKDHHEISVIAVFGKKVEEIQARQLDEEPTYYPGKEFLKDFGSVDISDIEIVDGSNRVPLIALTRLSVTESRSQVRYVLLETQDTFDVLTNDPSVINDMKIIGMSDDAIRGSLERLNEYLPVFEFIEQLPLFHCKISEMDDCGSVVRYPTALKIDAASSSVRSIKKHLPAAECPNYVNVTTIDVAGSATDKFQMKPKNLMIESGGYWQTLSPAKSGTDRDGKLVYGKTWVATQKSWYEITDVEAHLHDPISVGIGCADDVGTVYVLRNAQHPKDTYKIGFTTKEANTRADQLSSTSGQPDGFAIVQDWQVKNPRMVEQEVHNRLKANRVNDRREFFRLDYRKIRECIEDVIREAAADVGEA